MFFTLVLAVLVAAQIGLATKIEVFEGCSANFQVCAPLGVTTNSLGEIGSSWVGLYDSIVNLVSGYSINAAQPTQTLDPDGPARRDIAFCCESVATCLLLPTRKISLCWDRFTTNVFFPDGTYGSVISGDFNTSEGNSINLVYGDYVLKNGTKGNIYDEDGHTSEAPNTSTMSMPEVWTASGEGSAIPATGLGTTGSLVTVTSTIPGTTVDGSTRASITLTGTMTGCGNCPPYNTTIAGPTVPGLSRNASTSTMTSGIITPTMTTSRAAWLEPNTIGLGLLFVGYTLVTLNLHLRF